MRRSLMLFVDWFEPGYKAGGPIQSCRNLAYSLGGDMDIHIVTSDRDLNDTHAYADVRADAWNAYRAHVRVFYASPGTMGLAQIRRLIREVAPDCLYVNGIFSPRFSVLPVLAGRLEGVKTVVSPRGMLQYGSIRFKRLKKELFLAAMRLTGFHKRTVFHATDDQERKDVLRYCPRNAGVRVIENLFRTGEGSPAPAEKREGNLELVFLSRISRKKNLDLVLRVLAGVPEGFHVRLTVAGQVEEPAYRDECERLMRALPGHVSVEMSGPVPNHSLAEFYRRFHVFILPTHGENFGHAILEAMLNGKPVVISDRTPWKALEVRHAGMVVALEDLEGFRAAILHFASAGQQEYDRWSEGALAFARERQSGNRSLKQAYLQMFE